MPRFYCATDDPVTRAEDLLANSRELGRLAVSMATDGSPTARPSEVAKVARHAAHLYRKHVAFKTVAAR